ncbi:MAG: tetratricopeptide repeat protein [Treponema sp.]|jgi:tetratricopeptide (TPR) repeat protein|nr:tetratricopeptide repeat protein [Treponema sp.]
MAERTIHALHASRSEGEKKSFSEAAGAFLGKYRIVILSAIGGLLVAALAIGIVNYVITQSHARGLEAVEEIAYTLENTEADKLDAAVTGALSSLEEYADGKSVVAVRANLLKADLFFRDKKYEEARVAWIAASEAQKKAYTAPTGWYNAAVCSEELGDIESAAAYYEKAAAFENFALKTHTLFSLGRIKDASGDYTGAAAQYQKLQDAYPDDSWTSLAISRLIALRAEGKIQ